MQSKKLISLPLEKRCKLFKENGTTYDPITGDVISRLGRKLKDNLLRINYLDGVIQVQKHTFGWYLINGTAEEKIYHIDNNRNNNKYSNLTIISRSKYNKAIQGSDKPNKRYFKEAEFTKEIIISQGKGKLTKEAERMLVTLTEELIKKFTYSDPDLKYDCKAFGFLAVLENWRMFNHKKFESAFPYFTEVAKRGIVNGYNKIYLWKDNPSKQPINNRYSLSNQYSF